MQLLIEICNNRIEANARKEIIKAVNPGANWMTRIIDNVTVVTASIVENIDADPVALPPLFTPDSTGVSSPAVALLIWTED